MQFRVFEPNIEVNGQTILSVVDGLGKFKDMGYKILADNGISTPLPNCWYSQQAWLNTFKYISEKLGPYILCQIGIRIPENADWPPRVLTIFDALSSIDVAYHMNHRKNGVMMYNPIDGTMQEGIGHYGYEKVSENEIAMMLTNPYPCEFDIGIIKATSLKYSPTSKYNISIFHDETQSCRKNGDESCVISIKW